MVVALAVAVAIAACSGKPRAEEATHGAASREVAPADDAAADVVRADAVRADATDAAHTASPIGDLQVRVEWPDVPVAARTSPGRTPCHTPRAPAVSPTTTWGIPDALVVVDGPPAVPAVARVTLADCALAPRLIVGTSLAITSAVDRPARLVLRKRGALDHLAAGDPLPVQLPIAGHTVTAALDAGAIYALQTDAADPEVAVIAALPGGHVTDASGHAVIRGLAAGSHAVTAWLPPRAGQPARTGRGTARIAAGELTELTVTLGP